jgi:hypothetical protein
VLYDNVFFRRKGTTSRDLFKRSHRVNFNAGHDFDPGPGQKAVRELNLNSEYVDPAYCRQYLSLWMQRQSGVGGAPHFPVRVQMNGAFWQLAFHTLAADKDLLDYMGLNDRGALYKQVGELRPGAPEKENRNWEDNSDYNALANAISESRTLAQRTASLHDLTDVATVINYIAVTRLTQEADDVWANMVLHRDSEGSLNWRPVPFDLNLSFGQLFYDGQSWNTVVHATMDNNKSHPLYGSSVCRPQYPNNPSYNNLWNRLYDVVIQDPTTRSLLLRRMRTLMDRFYQPPGTPYAQRPLEAELDALWARIQPEAVLDRQVWGWPPQAGVYGLGIVAPAQAVSDVKTLYLDPRRTHLYTTHSINNTSVAVGITNTSNAGLPNAQPANAVINIGQIEFNPASGNQDQEYIQLTNPNAFAVDVSNWQIAGAVEFVLPGGSVIAAGGSLYLSPNVAAFRTRTVSPKAGETRFVQGNYGGHLSNLGETLTLLDPTGATVSTQTYVGNPSPAQKWLAISELMYAPPGDGLAEFIELVNLSATETLDLTGVHFSSGVEFSFTGSAITSLAPGARVLVVRSRTAFEAVYGLGKPIAGEFANDSKLDNDGETLKLDDAGNSTIFEFHYEPAFPWPVAGNIVLSAPQNGNYPNHPENWRLSVNPAGSPGTGDAVAFSGTAADLPAYALGTTPALTVGFETLPGETELAIILTFQRSLVADDVIIIPEARTALDAAGLWNSEASAFTKLSETRVGVSSQAVVRYRVTGFPNAPQLFARLRLQTR